MRTFQVLADINQAILAPGQTIMVLGRNSPNDNLGGEWHIMPGWDPDTLPGVQTGNGNTAIPAGVEGVVQRGSNGNGWYAIWRGGLIEQWQMTATGSGTRTWTYPLPVSAIYSISCGARRDASNSGTYAYTWFTNDPSHLSSCLYYTSSSTGAVLYLRGLEIGA